MSARTEELLRAGVCWPDVQGRQLRVFPGRGAAVLRDLQPLCIYSIRQRDADEPGVSGEACATRACVGGWQHFQVSSPGHLRAQVRSCGFALRGVHAPLQMLKHVDCATAMTSSMACQWKRRAGTGRKHLGRTSSEPPLRQTAIRPPLQTLRCAGAWLPPATVACGQHQAATTQHQDQAGGTVGGVRPVGRGRGQSWRLVGLASHAG